MDSNGRSLEQIYGPLSEGSDLTLLCLSKGGKLNCVMFKRRQLEYEPQWPGPPIGRPMAPSA